MLSLIVAMAENRAIGKDNNLLWRLPADLRRFKSLTLGHTVIMGRRTFASLPVAPLKDRRNIIISRTIASLPACEVANSVEDALARCASEEEVFVIGGGSIYEQTLPFADRLYVTWIHRSFEADTCFPDWDEAQWMPIDRSPRMHDDASGLDFTYITYQRITNSE
ncbi:MAG: dihydrofolate reductase [Prevotellaceae bacterium]|jgi:dihydrofolate reductase|nr:dihydrofolate reductase [Prevotellaceae bacterium]